MQPAATSSPHHRRAFWLLLLYALVVIGAGIGQRDPWPSDEPRFTLSAVQMVQGGDWLFPHRGTELYPDKPPMLMWAEAAGFEVVHDWRVAFLLPSLLAALGCMLLVYDLGRRSWDRKTGLYAAAALLLVFQFVYQFKRAQIDPLVIFFITAANWGLLRHMLGGPNWRAYWFGCFCAGLGVITKGVGFIALFMLLPYAVAARGRWNGVARMEPGAWWRWLLGLAACLLAIALWLVPMLLVARAREMAGQAAYGAYVQDILFHQTADRYADAWHHLHSTFYYLPIIAFSWLPLSLTYFGTFPRWWQALKRRDGRIFLPLVWMLLVLVFFSASPGKRDVYIMPMLPMLALITAPFLQELLPKRWLRAAGLAFIALMGAAFVLGGAWALLGSPHFARHLSVSQGLGEDARQIWWMAVVIGVLQLALAATLRMRRAVAAVCGGMTVLWLIWGFWGYPLLNGASSARDVMRAAQAHLATGDRIGLVAWKEQNMLMLKMQHQPAVDFGFRLPWHIQFERALKWQAADPAHRWIFLQGKVMGHCVRRSGAVHLGRANRRDWWMFKARAVVPGCRPETAGDENPDAD